MLLLQYASQLIYRWTPHDVLHVAQRHAFCAGCTVKVTAPKQGDVRLVNIPGTNFTTQPCDDVHLGGVEFFNDGQWGRICNRRGFPEMYNVPARVICRQLGFPFGSVIDLGEVSDPGNNYYVIYSEDYAEEDDVAAAALVWATDVDCTGTEERLADCFFPQAFGDITRPDQPRAPDARPGITNAECRFASSAIVGVACRRFAIDGALRLLVWWVPLQVCGHCALSALKLTLYVCILYSCF